MVSHYRMKPGFFQIFQSVMGAGPPVKEIANAEKTVPLGIKAEFTQIMLKIIVTAMDVAADKVAAVRVFGISGDYGFWGEHGPLL
jgi:hypothetical protein